MGAAPGVYNSPMPEAAKSGFVKPEARLAYAQAKQVLDSTGADPDVYAQLLTHPDILSGISAIESATAVDRPQALKDALDAIGNFSRTVNIDNINAVLAGNPNVNAAFNAAPLAFSLGALDAQVVGNAPSQKELARLTFRDKKASQVVSAFLGNPLSPHDNIEGLIEDLRGANPNSVDALQEKMMKEKFEAKTKVEAQKYIDKYNAGKLTDEQFRLLKIDPAIHPAIRAKLAGEAIKNPAKLVEFNGAPGSDSVKEVYGEFVAQIDTMVGSDGKVDAGKVKTFVDSKFTGVTPERRAIVIRELSEKARVKNIGDMRANLEETKQTEARKEASKKVFTENLKQIGKYGKYVALPAILFGIGGALAIGGGAGGAALLAGTNGAGLIGIGAGLLGGVAIGAAAGGIGFGVAEWKGLFSDKELQDAQIKIAEANGALERLKDTTQDRYANLSAELAKVFGFERAQRMGLTDPNLAASGMLKVLGLDSDQALLNGLKALRTNPSTDTI